MPDYKSMYFQLAAKVADVVDILIEAQNHCEDDYIQGDERTEEREEDIEGQ